MHSDKPHRGWVAIEALVSVTLLGMLLTGLVLARLAFGRADRYLMYKQRCAAAAEAQLDSLAATGQPLADDRVAELWPKVSTQIERRPGTGVWDGLQRVGVTATAEVKGRTPVVTLTRYLPAAREVLP